MNGADSGDAQPVELVTVKVYVPEGIVVARYVVPLPILVLPPGRRVSVQFPDAGRPLNATLPVEDVQVVWLTVPITGAVGEPGWGLMTA